MKIEISNIEEISILDINRKLKSIEADLEYYLLKKENAFNKTQPTPVDITKEPTQGGKRENKFDKYVITNEELDPIIDLIQKEKRALENLLENKLKSTGEYKVIIQVLIGLKERHYSWARVDKEYISTGKLPVSLTTCRNLLRKYLNKRNV
jgi:hypothetical protein